MSTLRTLPKNMVLHIYLPVDFTPVGTQTPVVTLYEAYATTFSLSSQRKQPRSVLFRSEGARLEDQKTPFAQLDVFLKSLGYPYPPVYNEALEGWNQSCEAYTEKHNRPIWFNSICTKVRHQGRWIPYLLESSRLPRNTAIYPSSAPKLVFATVVPETWKGDPAVATALTRMANRQPLTQYLRSKLRRHSMSLLEPANDQTY